MRVAIIPARGGSRRIPRKNIKTFHGKPIIAYSIETAQLATDSDGHTPLFDDVWVSTEDEEIAAVARRYGARVIERDSHLAQDEVGTQMVMANAITEISRRRRGVGRIIEACCIYATCPMLTNADLERGYRALRANSNTRYAFAVAEEPFGPAGYFYWGDAHAFLQAMPLVAEHSVMVPIPPERCVDINTPEDWARAEEMYAALNERTPA